MDDTTILAVCPPCHLPPNVTKTGVYRGGRQRSLAAAHAAITVCGTRGIGLLSTSACSVKTIDLPDETSVISIAPAVTVEYQFPGHITHYFSPSAKKAGKAKEEREDDDDAEAEFEFSEEQPSSKAPETIISTGNAESMDVDETKVATLLQEGIDAWRSVHREALNAAPVSPHSVREQARGARND